MRRLVLSSIAAAVLAVGLTAQSGAPAGGLSSIDTADLRKWLTYIASDELAGREVYSEGLGLAASYIADHLKAWGVKPGAPDGTYFQSVRVVTVRNSGRSSIVAEVNGETRTFEAGAGISFPANVGAARTFTSDDVVFAGYGLQSAGDDENGGSTADSRGKVVVWLGPAGPASGGGERSSRQLYSRSRRAIEKGAAAVIAPPSGSGRGASGRGGATGAATGGGGGRASTEFTTAQRYDGVVAPVVTAQDEFFEFLFSGADVPYAELKTRAERQEPLPQFPLAKVRLTFRIAPEYSIATTRLSRNVVGIVEGTDPQLEDTYVAFGAHYDHVGYQETAPAASASRGNSVSGCDGQFRPEPRAGDIVYNGADDDGSGTVALMAIARAFALGPKPRRSVVFVWHTGEEAGLHGSRYNADHPVVPNESIVAHLNLDMVGRNRCDDPDEANTVYLIGSDRISTELHNLSEDTNAALEKPLTLDYELNDPADPQSLYTRSDHYSYAAKGIPVIFYTTGLHRDYHYLTDEVEKIDFDKLARVTRLVYATGARLANLDRPPLRDNKGPRAGRERGGRISDR